MFKRLVVAITALTLSTAAIAGDYHITPIAISQHITSSGDYNEIHPMLGVEYVVDGIGYSLSTFKNSYYKTSIMYNQTAYIDNNQDYKFFLSAGVSTGYKDTGAICFLEAGNFCSVLGAGIVWQYNEIQPRVTLLGEAVVFSVSYRW